jgi:hypothetical protein
MTCHVNEFPLEYKNIFATTCAIFLIRRKALSNLSIRRVEDTKGVIRIRISKKNRQHNGQKKKYKRTINDLQNIHIKLKIE